jgi:aminoglycoside phosphotransferase (APT) family kinase protein
LTIAWTFFFEESRDVFRARLGLDAATWARARGWALWKASCMGARDVIDVVVADHRRFA